MRPQRILKLLLRHNADINATNNSGNTVLHYCFSYGNEDLANYLIDKGADDSIVNIDGLTCYEGLSAEGVEGL